MISILVVIWLVKVSMSQAEGQIKAMSGAGKTKRFQVTKNTNIKFSDVAGLD